MKSIIKAFIVAFSMYSKIPMPRFNWASEDMKYHLCFFPLVGAVIGALEYLWFYLSSSVLQQCPELLVICVAIAIPLLVTGGFHMDGFLDTMDALHSYGDKEKKLSILKDPHVGAFAIICVVVYFLLTLGFSSVIYSSTSKSSLLCLCFSFVISRCLSGISVTYFTKAKKDGMAAVESESSNKKVVGIILFVELFLSTAALTYLTRKSILCTEVNFACIGLTFLYYYHMSKKQFGGINGDLAGFFVCISEFAAVTGAALYLLLGL